MVRGLLEVHATLDLNQFWPDGESDADTTRVVVQTEPGAFRFRPHPDARFSATRAFEDVRVVGRIRKKPIDAQGRMTVRLEGIDAPELHYTPPAALKKDEQTADQRRLYLEWNLKYRQYLAETATRALAGLLAQPAQNPLPCLITTAVDEPDEVFDTYGRFVGYLKVKINGDMAVVNDWLTRQGWTLPAFYSSMLDHEIVSLQQAGAVARRGSAGVWAHLSRSTRRFDFALVYRGKHAPVAAVADAGPVVVPKLFRRLAAWSVNRRAQMVTTPFRRYLQAGKEYCFDTADFLTNGVTAATPILLGDLIDPKGMFTKQPDEVVFQEAPTRVAGADGSVITW